MKYYKQEKVYSCGAACARMMLSEFGIFYTEEQLINMLEVNQFSGMGTKNWDILKEYVSLELINNSSVEQLRDFLSKGAKITVAITRYKDCPHYVVIESLDSELTIKDPFYGDNIKMSIEDFEKIWYTEEDCPTNKFLIALNNMHP